MNEKTKAKLTFTGFVILGIIALPLLGAIFIVDRVIMAPLVWTEPKKITIWIRDFELIAYSLLRVSFAIVMYETYNLLIR